MAKIISQPPETRKKAKKDPALAPLEAVQFC